MHDIEPYHHWRAHYVAAEDKQSPFFGVTYDEFSFSKKVYNYFIHPQWDDFGSATLYIKVLFVEYDEGYAILELIGEWNDCLYNDIMYLKRYVIDKMIPLGIHNFVLMCDNVLNFHASDDAYYEEWYDDIKDEQGHVIFVNTHDHVLDEIEALRLQYYIHFGEHLNEINWRKKRPKQVLKEVLQIINNKQKLLIN